MISWLFMHTSLYTCHHAYHHPIQKYFLMDSFGHYWGSKWWPHASPLGVYARSNKEDPTWKTLWEDKWHMVLDEFSFGAPLRIWLCLKLQSCSSWAEVFAHIFFIFFGAMSEFLRIFWWTPVLQFWSRYFILSLLWLPQILITSTLTQASMKACTSSSSSPSNITSPIRTFTTPNQSISHPYYPSLCLFLSFPLYFTTTNRGFF